MQGWQRDCERLEAALRLHGFQVGVTTEDDEAAISGLLSDLYRMFPQYGRTAEPPVIPKED